MGKVILVVFIALILAVFNSLAGQFDATTVPKGALYLKIHPEILVTSARFDDSGDAVNIPHLSQLTYIDNQFELYYGIMDSLMAGILLPVAYVRRSYVEEETSSTTEMRNPWIVVKHQFWSDIIWSASSLRVKLPITDFEPLEEGFDVDDKQVDIYPIYYLDWQMPFSTYIYSQIGYKYRVKSGEIKPSDELKLAVETGYAIVPGIVRMFTISDYTRFFGGETDGEEDELSEGYLYTISAGVRFSMGRNLKVEVLTKASPSGRNQFRGIGGHVGIKYAFGI